MRHGAVKGPTAPIALRFIEVRDLAPKRVGERAERWDTYDRRQSHHAHRATDESPGNESSLKGESREVTMPSQTTQILLVEDEDAHAELIQLSFESRPDVRLAVATTLREARSRLAESTPDLMIVDSLLPDGRGLELLQNPPQTMPGATILMTSQADETMRAEAMASGATQYVVKSEVTLLEMPAIADGALGRRGPERDR